MAQNVGSDEMEFCIRGTTKKPEIIFPINVHNLGVGSKVISPDFHLAPGCLAYVAFQIHKNCISVSLCNTSIQEIDIERRIAIHVNDRKVHEERDAHIYSLKKGHEEYVMKSLDKEIIFNKDRLKINLWVSIKEIVGNEICHLDAVRKLRDDFKNFQENPIYSDVTLIVGDDRIKAHWSFLCARSSYFKNLYDSQMKERVENSITITNFSLSTVKKVIQFLYAADFVEEGHFQEFLDLYSAADMYDVMDLRGLCARQIMNNATVDNAGQILLLAQRHFDNDLKLRVTDFIQLHFDSVSQTDGWKKFEESEPVAAELLGFLWSKKN